MKIRALDTNGDWTFGVGLQNYLINQNAVALDIKTRLYAFLGDCFFDTAAGIDWFNLLGSKNEAALVFSVRGVILETPGVSAILSLTSFVDEQRNITIFAQVSTTFGDVASVDISFPVTPFSGVSTYVGDLFFTGQSFIDVDTSQAIPDARNAIWMLYDVSSGYVQVLGAVTPLNAASVRVSMAPPPTGTFHLVGIA